MDTYKGFTLDKFQQDAIASIEKGHSIVVSAATGTGKTLVADYVIGKAIAENKRAIYTAPIKALSNQKFREFKAEYGDKIGMLTGDVVINPQAQILIMTTEIYRNMLLEKSKDIDTVKYVVFDEIHFINDIERGTVWEESLIFSHPDTRFVCLSATIPNYKQFARWIQEIKGHTVDTVNYMDRAVPLHHQFFDINLGITDIDSIKKDITLNDYPQYEQRYKKTKKVRSKLPSHTQLVNQIAQRKLLPAIFFSFSRALCESRALELSKKRPFTTDDQRKEIITLYRKTVPENTRVMLSAKKLHTILTKGIGVHHAGMLPKLKEIVELLFDKGLIQVLYATETFAVGINMPAKTVCFGSLEKYDGISFRLVNSKEYFQLAGRAGRRGIDTVGHSISIIDRNKTDQLDKIKKLTSKDSEPIQSQYNLSYNTVLNLIRNHTQKEIEIILKSNFGYFVKKEDQGTVRIIQSFHNYSRILEKYGFLENKQLTWKGEFATRIYTKEMEITEIVYDKMLEQFTEIEILSLVAGLVYEPRRMDTFELKGVNIDNIFKTITTHKFLARRVKKTYIQRMASVVEPWATGCEFEDLLKICSLAEGDIIRLFRLLMDMLRQIKGSLMSIDPYNPTIEKITNCIKRIDRDIISVEL